MHNLKFRGPRLVSPFALLVALGTVACDDEGKAEAKHESQAAGGGNGASGGGSKNTPSVREGTKGEDEGEADAAGLVFTVSGPQLPETVTFHVPNERVRPYIGTNSITYNGGKLMKSPIAPEGGGAATLRSFTFDVKGTEAGTFADGKFDISMNIDVGTDDDINLGEDPKGTVELSLVDDDADEVVGKLELTVGDSGHEHDGVRYKVTGTIRSSKSG